MGMNTPPDDSTQQFNTLVDKHVLDRLQAEDESAFRIWALLEASRQDMFRRLLQFQTEWGSTERYTPQYLVLAIRDINGIISQFTSAASESLHNDMLLGWTGAQEQTIAELGVFEVVDSLRPSTPINTLLTLIDSRTENLQEMTRRLNARIIQEISNPANHNQLDAEALQRAGATVEEIKNAIGRGLIEGQGTRGIAERIAGADGVFPQMGYHPIMSTVRIAINESYNEGHDETIRRASEIVPGIGRAWCSALVRSTPICLGLHGATAGVGEDLVCRDHANRGKRVSRPPAIGGDLVPAFHLCRSRLVPNKASWPPNPKLAPLSPEDIAHFAKGGDFREKDKAQPKNGFRHASEGAKEELARRNRELGLSR